MDMFEGGGQDGAEWDQCQFYRWALWAHLPVTLYLKVEHFLHQLNQGTSSWVISGTLKVHHIHIIPFGS